MEDQQVVELLSAALTWLIAGGIVLIVTMIVFRPRRDHQVAPSEPLAAKLMKVALSAVIVLLLLGVAMVFVTPLLPEEVLAFMGSGLLALTYVVYVIHGVITGNPVYFPFKGMTEGRGNAPQMQSAPPVIAPRVAAPQTANMLPGNGGRTMAMPDPNAQARPQAVPPTAAPNPQPPAPKQTGMFISDSARAKVFEGLFLQKTFEQQQMAAQLQQMQAQIQALQGPNAAQPAAPAETNRGRMPKWAWIAIGGGVLLLICLFAGFLFFASTRNGALPTVAPTAPENVMPAPAGGAPAAPAGAVPANLEQFQYPGYAAAGNAPMFDWLVGQIQVRYGVALDVMSPAMQCIWKLVPANAVDIANNQAQNPAVQVPFSISKAQVDTCVAGGK